MYLTNTRRWVNKVVNKNEFICFDTETYKGTCKLLTDSNGNYIYNPTFKECLDFLWLYHKKTYYRAFWNIDFDISAILKLWNDIEQIRDLIHGKVIKYDDYSMYYIRPKMFRLAKGIDIITEKEYTPKKDKFIESKRAKKSIFFVDLYAMYKKSLEVAAVEFLNDKKIDTLDANLINTDLTYWIKNRKEIIKYCLKDAKLTANLGNILVKEVKACKILLPKFFTSPASLAKQYFRYKARIPSLKYVPTNILDIAYQCYFGGRFEVLKRGFFDKLYCYDINSAYPETISKLPSLKYGHWQKVNKISRKEIIGYYKVILDIPQGYISFLPFKLKSGLVVFPSGVFITWITWYEADLMRDLIKGVSYGYEYMSKEKEYCPFAEGMKHFYSEKTKYKNTNETFYWLIKLPMNSLYGCFVERHRKIDGKIYTGILFNSVYGSIITGRTRWKLFKDVPKKYWNTYAGFHTDSIISESKLPLKLDDKLGNWNLDYEGSGVILNTGVYQIGKKVRHRGFKGADIDLINLLKQNKKRDHIPFSRIKVLKIAESLQRFNNIDNVNIFTTLDKKLYLHNDKKRNWNSKFKNCIDVLSRNYSSKTLHFSYISDKNLE